MPRKLLLADDSITIQKVIEIILAQEDFEIKSVGDGEEALKLLNTFRPDVVLADVAMPMIDGYQLCEKIRGNPALAHVPVVLLAGAFEPYDEARASEAGASGVLIKPFESKELISKVKSVVSRPTDLLSPSLPAQPETEAEMTEEPEEASPAAGAIAEVPEAVYSVQPVAEAGFPAEGESTMPGEAVISEMEEFRKNIMDEEAPPDAGEPFVPETSVEEKILPDMFEEPAGQAGAGPENQEMIEAIEKAVDRRLAGVIEQQVLPYILSAVKESLLKELSGRIPSLLEGMSRDVVSELSAAMRPEIERQMKKAVPEVAEALIRKEIEKITSEG